MVATLKSITAGDAYTTNAAITKDGVAWDLTGATGTVSIADYQHPTTKLITDHAVTISVPETAGNVVLDLTAAESILLRTPYLFQRSRLHIADFKFDIGGTVNHTQKFLIPVTRGVT